MAIKAPKPDLPQPKAIDVDDAHADRFHGKKKEEIGKGVPEGQRPEQKERPQARRAGHVADDHHEEQVADPEAKELAGVDKRERTKKQKKKKKTKESEKARDKKRRQQDSQEEQKEQPQPPKITAGHLAHDDNWSRSEKARGLGFDQSPGISEIVGGQQAEPAGESLGELLPSARGRAHPDLPEAEMRPPDFLTSMEAMSDIYMRMRGRMSRKTKDLLEGPDLEDLLGYLEDLFDNQDLVRKSEAHILGTLYVQLKEDPGPLLLGLNDPRLTEVWRLFLDGWDIWEPPPKDEDDIGGVDLFWEGDAEDDEGNEIEILQSLQFRTGEITLHTRMGETEDTITFDGEAFYRLKH